jgi:predicted transcriptional regulator
MRKLTVQLTDEMDQVLGDLAEARGLAKTQVLRHAVLLMRYLDEASAQGTDFVLRERDTGKERQLVFESGLRRGLLRRGRATAMRPAAVTQDGPDRG